VLRFVPLRCDHRNVGGELCAVGRFVIVQTVLLHQGFSALSRQPYRRPHRMIGIVRTSCVLPNLRSQCQRSAGFWYKG